MAEFSALYTQPDGMVPFWGDADDARVLPFGNQALNDHRYLSTLVGYLCNNSSLLSQKQGSLSESLWLYGTQAVTLLQRHKKIHPKSYITCLSRRWIFISCAIMWIMFLLIVVP